MTSADKTSESRKFGRYNVEHDVAVVFDDVTNDARITNESIGGARLEFSSPVSFAVGSEVIIRQGDIETVGYVRNLGCLDESGMFAGVSWDPPEDAFFDPDQEKSRRPPVSQKEHKL